MTKIIAIIHSNYKVIEILSKEILGYIPQVEIINLLDESIVKEIKLSRSLNSVACRKAYRMAESATESGAEAVLCSCSSISPIIKQLQIFFSVPILSVDSLFFQEVVKGGRKLLLLGTNLSVLETVKKGINDASRQVNRDTQVETVFCCSGQEKASFIEYNKHLAKEIEKCFNHRVFDKALLAQLSMVPALTYLPEQIKVKILHAIPFIIMNIKKIIGEQ